jgi:hypothetical protein
MIMKRGFWMAVQTRLLRQLTRDEYQAASNYGADAIFFHAHAKGRLGDYQYHAGHADFCATAAVKFAALDSAIKQCELEGNTNLYSAHGVGVGVRGALTGDPARFVGLQYCYRGYISTSSDLQWTQRFVVPRAQGPSQTVLEFHLPAGFNALDMNLVGHSGEFEFLLGRSTVFDIVNGSLLTVPGAGPILLLTLAPAKA